YTLGWKVPDRGHHGIIGHQRAVIRNSYARSLPWRENTALNSFTASRTRKGRYLSLRVGAPIAASELGQKSNLEALYAAMDENARDGFTNAIVFESYHGRNVSGNPFALYEMLRRRFPEYTCYWSVSSLAVDTPPDAEIIVQGTAHWFRVVHRAKYLINNSNFPNGFRKQT